MPLHAGCWIIITPSHRHCLAAISQFARKGLPSLPISLESPIVIVHFHYQINAVSLYCLCSVFVDICAWAKTYAVVFIFGILMESCTFDHLDYGLASFVFKFLIM
jgi:hypothetical protein